MRRRVAVFTSTRADAGPLGPVIERLATDEAIDLQLLVTGTHLSAETGLQAPAAATVETIPVAFRDDDPLWALRAAGDLTTAVAEAIQRLRPDVLLVLGDRWELLPVATATVLLQVPLAHLHGGEVTEGAMDDRFRHAITKLADLHLCVDQDARRRLQQLGEEPWRITVTGAPALDRLRDVAPLDDDRLAAVLGARVTRPFALVTYHAPTVDRSRLPQRADALFEAAVHGCATVLATHPGPDPGASVVRSRLEAAARRHDTLHVVPNLGPSYPEVLASADVVIGNSSSGLFEAASFRVPVVNVGTRQDGRRRPPNVIDVPEDHDQILAAIETALSPGFARALDGLVNPFGDGHAAERVVAVLRNVDLDRLPSKPFVDLDASER